MKRFVIVGPLALALAVAWYFSSSNAPSTPNASLTGAMNDASRGEHGSVPRALPPKLPPGSGSGMLQPGTVPYVDPEVTEGRNKRIELVRNRYRLEGKTNEEKIVVLEHRILTAENGIKGLTENEAKLRAKDALTEADRHELAQIEGNRELYRSRIKKHRELIERFRAASTPAEHAHDSNEVIEIGAVLDLSASDWALLFERSAPDLAGFDPNEFIGIMAPIIAGKKGANIKAVQRGNVERLALSLARAVYLAPDEGANKSEVIALRKKLLLSQLESLTTAEP